VTMT